MEENRTFGNHISTILKDVAGFLFLVAFILIPMLSDSEFRSSLLEDVEVVLPFCIFLLMFLLYMLGGPIFTWARTFISIQNNAIVIERKTIRREVNTIGIQHISNVNLEQNIIERVLGTCKVKLNTDSLSTADKTDVKIVLKRKDAEAFKQQILGIMNQEEEPSFVGSEGFEATDVSAGLMKMLIHGSLSISFVSILVAISCLWGAVESLKELWIEGLSEDSISLAISSMVIMASIAFGAIWSVIGGFIKYYNFKVDRIKDKVYIRYGLLKKVSYTIPVDRINGLRLAQSPQARAMKYYMAEILNVGLKDEEEESESFLLLYDKKEKIQEEIRRVLPEFAEDLDMNVEKQTAKVWAIWCCSFAIVPIFLLCVNGVVAELWPGWLKQSILISIAILALFVVHLFGRYKTEGVSIRNKIMLICDGSFRRAFTFLKYDKIQYLEENQNFIAKRFGVSYVIAYLLAAGADKLQKTPFINQKNVEILKEKILDKK